MPKNLKPRGRKRWDVLVDILSKDKIIKFVELGVWQGQTMEQVLAKLPNLCYFGVDMWEAPGRDQKGFGKDLSKVDDKGFRNAYMKCWRISQKYASRATLVKSDTAGFAKKIADHSIDCIFIDANHSYDGCKRDILAWKDKIVPGGILAGHDYANEHGGDVKQAVDEILGEVELYADHVWVKRM